LPVGWTGKSKLARVDAGIGMMEFVSATAQREAVIAVADSGEILTDPSDDW
jgi:hypothetical protein